jgi:hypothetical protein
MAGTTSSRIKILTTVVFVGLIGAAGYILAGRWQQHRNENMCQYSFREIVASTATIAEIDGKQERVCCPACALATARQRGISLKLLQLSDFNTKQPLDPKTAYLIRGSDVNPDMHSEPLVDAEKQPLPVHYDRCEPGILAFKTKSEAVAFQHQHGGSVLQVSDLGPDLIVQ